MKKDFLNSLVISVQLKKILNHNRFVGAFLACFTGTCVNSMGSAFGLNRLALFCLCASN
jgi:hypothetical protein